MERCTHCRQRDLHQLAFAYRWQPAIPPSGIGALVTSFDNSEGLSARFIRLTASLMSVCVVRDRLLRGYFDTLRLRDLPTETTRRSLLSKTEGAFVARQ